MIQRIEYLDRLWALKELQLIKVVTGIRRCGKSTLLQQFQQKLLETGVEKEQIISLNFEELENENLIDRKALYAYLKSKLCEGKYTYIFLDEVQKVEEFEKVVDSLYVKKNIDIYNGFECLYAFGRIGDVSFRQIRGNQYAPAVL